MDSMSDNAFFDQVRQSWKVWFESVLNVITGKGLRQLLWSWRSLPPLKRKIEIIQKFCCWAKKSLIFINNSLLTESGTSALPLLVISLTNSSSLIRSSPFSRTTSLAWSFNLSLQIFEVFVLKDVYSLVICSQIVNLSLQMNFIKSNSSLNLECSRVNFSTKRYPVEIQWIPCQTMFCFDHVRLSYEKCTLNSLTNGFQ